MATRVALRFAVGMMGIWILSMVAALQVGKVYSFWNVFALTRVDNYQPDVLLADTAGRMVNITFNEVVDSAPSWSPDGTQIAFVSSPSGNAELYIFDFVELTLHQLTFTPRQDEYFAAWSPDGTHLVYMVQTERGTNLYDLWTLDLDTGEQRSLVDIMGTTLFPVWSPDGDHIAFMVAAATPRIQVINYPSGDLLMQTPPSTYNPTWSPDGQQITYAGAGDLFVSNAIDTIYVQDATATSRPIPFQMDMQSVENPVWSPDGLTIAFIGEPFDNPVFIQSNIPDNDIFLLDLRTEQLTRLTNLYGRMRQLSWSSDGEWLIFSLTDASGLRVCFMRWDGSNLRCPDGAKGGFEPVWQPHPSRR